MFESEPVARTRNAQGQEVNEHGLVLSVCEFCRKPIAWVHDFGNPNARTAEGKVSKRIPIDPQPSRLGTLVVNQTAEGPRVGEMRHNQAAGFRATGGKTFIRHVKTCTKAAEMRRGVVARHKRK
jgi:hypothetical protein